MNIDDRHLAAAHEAGHAVVGLEVGFWPAAAIAHSDGTGQVSLFIPELSLAALRSMPEWRWKEGLYAVAGCAGENVVEPYEPALLAGSDYDGLVELGLDSPDHIDALSHQAGRILDRHARTHRLFTLLLRDLPVMHGDDLRDLFLHHQPREGKSHA